MAEDSPDRVIRARILLSAIRSRRAASAMLFLVAVLAVAAAAIGPMFLDSADTSVLTSTMRSAPLGEADLSILTSGSGAQMVRLTSAAATADELGAGRLGRALLTVDAGARFLVDGQQYEADVLARSDLTRHLALVDGTWPVQPGQVAISERSAATAHLGIGSRVQLTEPHASTRLPVTISALYRQPATENDDYWKGNDYFTYGSAAPPVVALDPLVTTFSTALETSRITSPQLSADIAWRQGASLAGGAALQSTLATITSRLASQDGLTVTSGLGAIVLAARHDDGLMSAVVGAIALQLILLSLLILYAVGRSTVLDRRQEAQFARRHGFPRSASFALAVGEPAALIAAALPVGLVAAWGALVILNHTLFAPGTPVTLSGAALAGAIAATLAGILAMAMASFELWRSRPSAARQGRAAGAAVDAVAVALALIGLVSLLTKGSLDGTASDPVASLGPGLLALGAGVVGLRLASLAIAAFIARTGESNRVAWFLALRHVGRRPSVLRQLLPLTVATAVLLFSVGSFFLASSNRREVAYFSVGAARVATLDVPHGVDVEAAVRRADPSGHEAMAAAYYSSPTGELLAVDSSRLASVAYWPSSLSREPLDVLARRLAPRVAPGVRFTGNRLRLALDVEHGTPPIALEVNFFDEKYQDSQTIVVGPIVAGRHRYAFSLSGACPATCRLINLSPQWANPNENYAKPVRFAVTAIASERGGHWRAVAFGVGKPATWQAQPSSIKVEGPLPGEVAFDIPGGQLPYGGLLLIPVDLPAALPGIVTNGAVRAYPPTPPSKVLTLEGLDGAPLDVKPVAEVSTLPLIGDAGAMVDLALAQRAITGTEADTTFQVWLAPSASSSILTRLRAEGITVSSITRASSRLGALDRSGLALAYAVALLVSPIAMLLAMATVVFIIVADGRGRRREIAALSIAGVPARAVRRSLALESAMVLGVALVVGSVVGYLADTLALASLPQFAAGTGGLAISRAVPVVPFACAIGVLALALALCVEITTRFVMRAARAGDPGETS